MASPEVTEPPGPGDRFIEGLLRKSGLPVILALNKIDRVPKPRILPAIEAWRQVADFAEIVPVSALKGENVDRLEKVLLGRLPVGEALYPEDFLTDLPERFFVAEMVRERILHHTREEIPYVTGVVIELFKEEEGLVRVHAAILVERDNQKGILIGRGGSMLKRVGTEARQQIVPLGMGGVAPPVDEDGALQLGQHAEERPARHLRLGDEAAMDHRAEHGDVEIGAVVADEKRRPHLAHLAGHLDLKAEGAAALQVIPEGKPLLCGAGQTHQQHLQRHGDRGEEEIQGKPDRRAHRRPQTQVARSARGRHRCRRS